MNGRQFKGEIYKSSRGVAKTMQYRCLKAFLFGLTLEKIYFHLYLYIYI